MNFKITPDPTPEEREALLRGLESLLRGGHALPPSYRSGWRQAAIRDAVGSDDRFACWASPSRS